VSGATSSVTQADRLGFRARRPSWPSILGWGALNATYATTFDTYKLERWTGYRLTSEFDIGIEGRVEGNVDYDAGRGGFTTLRPNEDHDYRCRRRQWRSRHEDVALRHNRRVRALLNNLLNNLAGVIGI
jgi:hypothetical protein